MKPGSRALGVAESYVARSSTIGGAVVQRSGRVEDFVFDTCTVGGSDVTEAILDAYRRLDRADIRVILVAGIALAWFNIVDLEEIQSTTDRPVVSVTFEESDGLADAIDDAFHGEERRARLEAYEALPPRQPVRTKDGSIYVRCVGEDDEWAARTVQSFTLDGSQIPEPILVAKRAARAVDRWRTERPN